MLPKTQAELPLRPLGTALLYFDLQPHILPKPNKPTNRKHARCLLLPALHHIHPSFPLFSPTNPTFTPVQDVRSRLLESSSYMPR